MDLEFMEQVVKYLRIEGVFTNKDNIRINLNRFPDGSVTVQVQKNNGVLVGVNVNSSRRKGDSYILGAKQTVLDIKNQLN